MAYGESGLGGRASETGISSTSPYMAPPDEINMIFYRGADSLRKWGNRGFYNYFG